jgi:hypothetical protein
MALDFRGDSHLEMDALMSTTQGMGIDGAFVDCPVSASSWKRSQLQSHTADAAPGTQSTAWNEVPPEEVEVAPAAAISTFVLVSALVVACILYAWVQRRSPHGAYKYMTSPRLASSRGAQEVGDLDAEME